MLTCTENQNSLELWQQLGLLRNCLTVQIAIGSFTGRLVHTPLVVGEMQKC